MTLMFKELKSLKTTCAFMNQGGALKEKSLRQAVLRALDRKSLHTENLLGGAATPESSNSLLHLILVSIN